MGGPGLAGLAGPRPRSLRALPIQKGKSETRHQLKRKERTSYNSIGSATGQEQGKDLARNGLQVLVEEGAEQKQARTRRKVQELLKQ